MSFVDKVEIPPIIDKILKKLYEHGQLQENDFKTVVLNLRISRDEYEDILQYLIEKDLVQKIPKLSVEPNGGTHNVILPTRRFM